MKNKIVLKLSLILSCMFLLGSCANKKTIVYYQNVEDVLLKESNDNKFETRLRADDLLMIIVSAEDPEAALPFNLANTMTTNPNNPAGSGTMTQHLYLVDSNGNIEFPVLGTINSVHTRFVNFTLNSNFKVHYSHINNWIVNVLTNLFCK